MFESKLFKRLKRATPGFDWTRHEDKITSGIPDCSYGAEGVGGWVELKTYDAWPRDPSTPLRFHDLKPTQVNWAFRRGRKQRLVWFLIGVADDWFLISWKHARKLGKLTQAELLAASDAHGQYPIPRSIAKILTGGVTPARMKAPSNEENSDGKSQRVPRRVPRRVRDSGGM